MQDPEPISKTFERWLNSPYYKTVIAVLSVIFWTLAGLNFFVPYSQDRWRIGLLLGAIIVGLVWLVIMILSLRNWLKRTQQRGRELLTTIVKDAVQNSLSQNTGYAAHSVNVKTIIEEAFSKCADKVAAIGTQISSDLRPVLLIGEPAEWALAYEINTRRYGWGYEQLNITVTINPDGSAEFKREIVVKAYRALPGLEQSLTLDLANSEDASSASTEPRLSVKGIGREVKLGEPYFTDGGWVTELTFTPEVDADSPGSFALTERIPKGSYAIGWTANDLSDKKITDQYYAFRIDRPTRELALRIYLPVGYRAENCKVQVRLIPPVRGVKTTRTDLHEETRITKKLLVSGPTGRRYELASKIDWPVLGRVYVVRWDPLSVEKTL